MARPPTYPEQVDGGFLASHHPRPSIAIATLLDPQAIIVGGGIAAAGKDVLDPAQERRVLEVLIAPRLVPSALGSDTQALGPVCADRQVLTTSELTWAVVAALSGVERRVLPTRRLRRVSGSAIGRSVPIVDD